MNNRYVKVKGHSNWFLLLESLDYEPDGLSSTMQEKIFRSQVCQLHNDTPDNRMDFIQRLKLTATCNIDYEKLAEKYGTILIREIGSFMTLRGNEIVDELFDKDFPISDYAEIVICENDEKAEYRWVKYLEKRFPDKKIVTINYFDLRSDYDIERYFNNAKYITFSTTFSKHEWFEKLTRISNSEHKVIGYSHTDWETALKINNKIEIIKSI